jgi:peptidoglycan/xylan/chitin deacetylase (PgdA/CDA1 family)
LYSDINSPSGIEEAKNMSTFASIEGHVPFPDHVFVEFPSHDLVRMRSIKVGSSATMLKGLKRISLQTLKTCGLFRLVRDSEWRRQQLVIVCYHGVALEDEHLWKPELYMDPGRLRQRLEILRVGGYSILPLNEAVHRLYEGDLPRRSVAITFDDGTYDFYQQAYPLLKSYGFPVTVYQTTYYCGRPEPIFRLICSYMLWTRRGAVLKTGRRIGLTATLDLRTKERRDRVEEDLALLAEDQNLSAEQKDELARKLAAILGIDYENLLSKRILQLMTPEEVAQLSTEGVQFELHTHRHRTPMDPVLFQREIRDNRERIKRMTGADSIHFCYPSGIYEMQFLPWLAAEGVVSATTCESGLASPKRNPLLLPRFSDNCCVSSLEFESWVTGVRAWLPRRNRRRRTGQATPLRAAV